MVRNPHTGVSIDNNNPRIRVYIMINGNRQWFIFPKTEDGFKKAVAFRHGLEELRDGIKSNEIINRLMKLVESRDS